MVIHYHGTPIGGPRQDVARFLCGRHALVPFARADDLAVVMECCQSFIIDNSAFTFWRSGAGQIDVARYMSWVESIYRHPGFDWCLIPDIISGSEDENRQCVHDWLSSAPPFLGTPVWHLHESLAYLDWLVEHFRIVALGSSGQWSAPGSGKWWSRIGEAMMVACDRQGRPRCKLHGLRMLNPRIFSRLPLCSADSTNAAVNSGSLSRYGSYPPPTRAQRAAVIAARIEAFNSAPVWATAQLQPSLL